MTRPSEQITHFLIVYDGVGTAPIVRVFEDSQEALREYGLEEQRLRENRGQKVVLIGAASLDVVKVTHPNLWDPVLPNELAREVLLKL